MRGRETERQADRVREVHDCVRKNCSRLPYTKSLPFHKSRSPPNETCKLQQRGLSGPQRETSDLLPSAVLNSNLFLSTQTSVEITVRTRYNATVPSRRDTTPSDLIIFSYIQAVPVNTRYGATRPTNKPSPRPNQENSRAGESRDQRH